MKNRHIETFRTQWSGITIEIRWEPNWLNLSSGSDRAHLEIEAVAPERAPLPISESGYFSQFTSVETVASYGGPVAYVEAWLEIESLTPGWCRLQEERRQLTLF